MTALFPDLVVNGESVPSSVIAEEAQNHEAPKGKPGIAWRKAANAVAVRTLLLQEGRRRGIDTQAQEVEPGRFETDEEALIRGLLDKAVTVEPPTTHSLPARSFVNRESEAIAPGRVPIPSPFRATTLLPLAATRSTSTRQPDCGEAGRVRSSGMAARPVSVHVVSCDSSDAPACIGQQIGLPYD